MDPALVGDGGEISARSPSASQICKAPSGSAWQAQPEGGESSRSSPVMLQHSCASVTKGPSIQTVGCRTPPSPRHWCISSGVRTQESALQQVPTKKQTHSLMGNHQPDQRLLDHRSLLCLINPIQELINRYKTICPNPQSIKFKISLNRYPSNIFQCLLIKTLIGEKGSEKLKANLRIRNKDALSTSTLSQ